MIKKLVVTSIFFIIFIQYILYSELSLGISLGEPTGISLNLKQNKNIGYDFGLSFNTKDNYVYLCVDLLKYNYEKIKSKELTGKIPVLYGLGLKIENTKNETHFGARIVGGIEYIFSDIPFNLFFKIAAELNITPATAVSVSPAVGIRYVFK